MKLFTKSDVERAARLATLYGLTEREPEVAIAKAVAAVVDDSVPYYSRDEVRSILQYALTREDVDDVLEEALELLRR
jgi:hypothetical protein